MAELPEIAKLSAQMNETLGGKEIENILLLQEKCSNVSAAEFQRRTAGAKVSDIHYRGKWILTHLTTGENILLSLGMGADVLYFSDAAAEPEKYQVKVLFTDGTGYTIRFWWFGKFLLVPDGELASEPSTKDIALDPFDEGFTPEYFASLLRGKKGGVKAFLMDQKNVGGIGNMYMHDILFKSGLHPQKKIADMSEQDVKKLYESILSVLNLSREKGAFCYECDFFGQKGSYGMEEFLVGYKENTPCPACGTNIVQIKTGSTSTYICPECQKL